MTVTLAQFLTIQDADSAVLYRWQNHWIDQVVDEHGFFLFNCSSRFPVSQRDDAVN